jgi:hypothetical protein
MKKALKRPKFVMLYLSHPGMYIFLDSDFKKLVQVGNLGPKDHVCLRRKIV